MPRPRRTLTGRREEPRRRERQALRRQAPQAQLQQPVDPPEELRALEQRL